MRKTVIISAVIISSVVTSFCVSNATYNSNVRALKVSKTDFSANTLIAEKSDIATAD